MIDSIIHAAGAVLGMAVALPARPAAEQGAQAKAAYEMLEQTIREFHADRTRLHPASLSMGGYGSWEVALQHPGAFAAIVAVCGGVSPLAAVPGLRVTTSGGSLRVGGGTRDRDAGLDVPQ